jgi:methylmalonyl-CoA carboxyltransferase large subunit
VAVKAADLVRDLSERQLAMERQLGELAGAVKALQARVAELSQPAAAAFAPAAGVKATAKEEVTPEILVVITAAVTAFLGKKVRIRSAKLLQSPYEVVNPWSQQGRAIVQASHHPRIRG